MWTNLQHESQVWDFQEKHVSCKTSLGIFNFRCYIILYWGISMYLNSCNFHIVLGAHRESCCFSSLFFLLHSWSCLTQNPHTQNPTSTPFGSVFLQWTMPWRDIYFRPLSPHTGDLDNLGMYRSTKGYYLPMNLPLWVHVCLFVWIYRFVCVSSVSLGMVHIGGREWGKKVSSQEHYYNWCKKIPWQMLI